ncbi:hypothetical protein KSP39_PZI011044 [Platanthera zijinensis]|uniref:Uncharacterized protein n=1 Tax=Platanthera zijinensis TaxID=2320716 RepID=A0AAP0BHE1_9ASPA
MRWETVKIHHVRSNNPNPYSPPISNLRLPVRRIFGIPAPTLTELGQSRSDSHRIRAKAFWTCVFHLPRFHDFSRKLFRPALWIASPCIPTDPLKALIPAFIFTTQRDRKQGRAFSTIFYTILLSTPSMQVSFDRQLLHERDFGISTVLAEATR